MKVLDLNFQDLMKTSIIVDETPGSGMTGDAKRASFDDEWEDEEYHYPGYRNYWSD